LDQVGDSGGVPGERAGELADESGVLEQILVTDFDGVGIHSGGVKAPHEPVLGGFGDFLGVGSEGSSYCRWTFLAGEVGVPAECLVDSGAAAWTSEG
jgi:hypothetical protein